MATFIITFKTSVMVNCPNIGDSFDSGFDVMDEMTDDELNEVISRGLEIIEPDFEDAVRIVKIEED